MSRTLPLAATSNARRSKWLWLLAAAAWQPALLLIVVWCARFLLSGSFGLYEDDYYFIGRPMGWSSAELLQSLKVLWTWPQGRPIGYLLSYVIGYLATRFGSFHALYFSAYILQAANALLIYFLLRRLGFKAGAWFGALAFALYPADTTQAFLTHAFQLQTSLAFLLLASHAYLSGHKPAAYLLSLGGLLTYESTYTVFLAVPLLEQRSGRPLRRELVRHVVTWAAILLAVMLVRVVQGESRIGGLGQGYLPIVDALWKTAAALWIGPAESLRAFWRGPQWSLQNWSRELTVTYALAFLVFAIAGYASVGRAQPGSAAGGGSSRVRAPAQRERGAQALAGIGVWRTLVVGAILWSLSYATSFLHFPPTAYFGRMTSVHMAGSLGAAVVVASLTTVMFAWADSNPRRAVVSAMLAAYYALMMAYGYSIQDGFARAWNTQRRFWTSAISQLPDLDEHTMIFVPQGNLPEGRFMQAFSWSGPLILSQLYDFPSEWTGAPRLFFVPDDWTDQLQSVEGNIVWVLPDGETPQHPEILPPADIIQLEWTNGRVQRSVGAIHAGDVDVALRPWPASVSQNWPHGPLFPLLIQEPN